MNQIKAAMVLIVMIFVLSVVAGVTPTLAGSPNSAPPTVALPTPVPTKPGATLPRPAGPVAAPTRAAPAGLKPTVAPAVVKAPRAPTGSWVTDFTLFNLSTSSQAAVNLFRYVQCVGACSTDTGTQFTPPSSWTNPPCAGCIPAGGSAYYNPASDASFPSSFSGSIVVSSTTSLAGTITAANMSTGSGYASDAYSAVSSPAPTVILPIVMSGLGVWNTQIIVQNAGGSNTNVTIHYVGANAPGDSTITNLPPNMSAIVDQAGLATNFNGSATVTSTSQNVAVIVEEYKTTGGVLIAYNGVPTTDANTTVYMPGFIIQGKWATDFTIVNTDSNSANVSVTFTGSSNTLTGAIAGNGSAYINGVANVYPAGWTGSTPSNFYGGATVTSTNGKNLVVVYNVANSGPGGAGNSQEGYVGFPPTKAATKIVVPLIEDMYSTGWVTTYSVLSIDGSAANLSLTYSPQAGSCNGSCSKTYNMTSGDAGAHTFNQVTDGHVNTGFLGAVTIQSTNGKQLVVIADQNNTTAASYSGGDAQAGFVGFVSP